MTYTSTGAGFGKAAAHAAQVFPGRRVRRLLQCGTALPLLLAAWPAMADPITQQSGGDIEIDAESASGTPIAVELSSTDGSVTVAVSTVTGAAGASTRDYVVGLETLSDGGITGTFGSITGTGDGELLGLGADSVDGAIELTVGTIDISGTATSGITAHSANGTVTITADSVVARGTGMDSQGEFFEAVQGVSDNNSVSIDVGHAETYGDAGSAIGAIAGGTVSIVADSAVAHDDGVIVAYANAAGDASVDIGSVTLTAEDGQGVYVSSAGGNASLAVDAIEAGDLAEAARVVAAGNIDVTLGNVNAGGGLTATSNNGDVAVAVNGHIVGHTFGGLGLTGRNVSVTMAQGASISAAGSGWTGIFASASDSIDIAATEIAATGATGINAESANGSIAIATETVSTSGNLASAILARTAGTIDIAADEVHVAGPGADPGVRGDGSGYRIEQGGVIVEGGNGAISIAAGTVDVAGEHRYGISARGNGAIDITAGDVTLASGDSVAVVARGGADDVSITTGTVTTTGASGVGVFANTTTGSIVIDAGTTRVENAGEAGQFTGDAVVATSGSGAISLTSADAFSAGLNGSAVVAMSGGDVTLDSGVAATSGDGGVAVFAQSTNGTLTVSSDSVTTTGANTRAIAAHAFNGVANAIIGDVTALGTNASGVLTSGREVNLVIDGAVRSTQIAVNVAAQGGLTDVTINGSVVSTDGPGLVSAAQNGVVTVSEGASVSGGTAGVVLLSGLQGGFTQFYNSGTVTGGAGAAVVGLPNGNGSVGSFYIQNNGTLVGAGDFAVVTAAGDDTLELTNLSQITGIADLGDGDDRLVLDLNDDAPEGAVGQVVSTINVEGLSVDSGAWRAEGAQSVYDFVEVEEGATLTVVENDEGSLAIETGLVELDGALRLDLSVDETEGDLGETTIVGAGSLHLVGTATVELTDTTGLQHTGGTFVENGELLLTTVYGGDIATSGEGVFELGEGGDFTGNLTNDGTFVFSQGGDYDFLGDFTGTGQLDKHGEGTLTFAGLYGFEGTTSVFGGTVAFTGQLSEDTELDISEGTVDLSQVEGGEQTIAELSGTGGTLQLGETQLVIQQLGNTVFSGSITGMGSLIKEGDGDLKLNGDGTNFTGTGQVDGGTMSVNGNFSNAGFVVNEGGTLGGAGTVGETFVDGGRLAPGNSIDTLTVNGDVAFTAASVFEVEVDPAGNADLLQVTGTATLGGAAVNVIAASGIYRPLTDYTILTAEDGVSGTFGSVDINLAFLDPTLAYSANAVTLRLVRNDIDFAAFGETPSQTAIAGLIEGLGYGNPLYDATLTLIDSDVAPSFASLTGEVYPAYGAAAIETAEMLRRQSTGSMVGEGAYGWATGLYNNVSSGTGAGEIELTGKGVAGGFGFGGNGFSASVGLGLLDHDNGGGDFANGDVTFAIGQLAYTGLGGLSVSAGAQFGWVDGETRRRTSLGRIGGAVSGGVEGDYLQLFGEIAYGVPVGSVAVEPFVGVSHVSVEFDDLTETGAPTALIVSGLDREVTFGSAGVRVSGDAGPDVRPYASAAYRHAWGDRASLATVGFAGTTATTVIGATPIAQDAAELSAGLSATSGRVSFEVGYDGTISKSFDSHGVHATATLKF